MALQRTNLCTQHETLTYWNIHKARLETDEMSMISCCVFGRFIEFLVFLVVMDGSKVVLEGLVEWDKRWTTLAHCKHCHSNKKTMQIEFERLNNNLLTMWLCIQWCKHWLKWMTCKKHILSTEKFELCKSKMTPLTGWLEKESKWLCRWNKRYVKLFVVTSAGTAF